MTHGSLYSGIGGWLLAAKWAGIENIFTVEIDDFCNKVLDKHFPNTDRLYDVRKTDFKAYQNKIDILSTSDPCQPFSYAGKRGGKSDDRYLWANTIRAIREIRPSYVVFENVPGFISLAFEDVAADLEGEGYTLESFIIPACGVEAWHNRDRLWIIAYNTKSGTGKDDRGIRSGVGGTYGREKTDTQNISNNNNTGNTTPRSGVNRNGSKENKRREGQSQLEFSGHGGWEVEPDVGRVVHGVPGRVDRLKSLGNSIVPQIAHIIFEAIKEHMKRT